jgi:hypothetical protein
MRKIIIGILVFIAISCNQAKNTKTEEKLITEYSEISKINSTNQTYSAVISDKNNPESILYAFLQFAEHQEWGIFWNGMANEILDSLAKNGHYSIFWVTNDSIAVPDEMLSGSEKDFEEEYLQIYKSTYNLDTTKNTIKQEGYYIKGLYKDSLKDCFEYNLSNSKFTYSHISKNQKKLEVFYYNPNFKCQNVFVQIEKERKFAE